VPVGAKAGVTSATQGQSSTVTLKVSGLLPNRTYGSHAHQKPCGPAAPDSGAHFQHSADPVSPSVDPAYANAVNEVWLDFTTDAAGAASVTATQDRWAFTDQAAPQSVVIHAKATATEPGKAGTAGDRAACVTVRF
jgi:superoxide dismutase, Cu-Zn family